MFESLGPYFCNVIRYMSMTLGIGDELASFNIVHPSAHISRTIEAVSGGSRGRLNQARWRQEQPRSIEGKREAGKGCRRVTSLHPPHGLMLKAPQVSSKTRTCRYAGLGSGGSSLKPHNGITKSMVANKAAANVRRWAVDKR
jgi:hypothetical protein